MTRVAINGFGRIGRLVARAILERPDCGLELVAINDLADAQSNAWLFSRDSVHGRFPGDVAAEGNDLVINGKHIKVTAERDPAKLPHRDNGVELALECTGFFTDREGGQKHLDAGAKRVLISAPAKGVDRTIVYGVNHDKLEAGHTIVSNASCTTNCLAPVAKVMNDTFGIERGLMTTIHSYTNDQKILDQIHTDMRRARAAGMSIIPTTTGAARAVGEVLPELKGKLDAIFGVGELGRVALGGDLDALAVDDQIIAVGADFAGEFAMDAVALEQHRVRLGVGEVVDRDQLEPAVGPLEDRPRDQPSNASETVDCHLGHFLSFSRILGRIASAVRPKCL